MNENLKELIIVILAALILGIAVAYADSLSIVLTTLIMLATIGANIVAKKLSGNYFEANVKTKFWEIERYGFYKYAKFKKSIPMPWLPLILSFLSYGYIWWLAIVQFDISPRVERVAKKHGFHSTKKRYSSMTGHHLAIITAFGIFANLILAIVGYIFAGNISWMGLLSKINVYYAMWSLVPISNLDGSKILFGNRPLWFTLVVIMATIVLGGFTIF